MYNSTVVGAMNSVGVILGMKNSPTAKNPRLGHLRAVFEALGADRRNEFYAAVVAIAEFAVYRVLDFIETYSRFDSESNEGEFPRLTLAYNSLEPDGVQTTTLSEFGSDHLGRVFKEIARDDEVRALVDSLINQRSQL